MLTLLFATPQIASAIVGQAAIETIGTHWARAAVSAAVAEAIAANPSAADAAQAFVEAVTSLQPPAAGASFVVVGHPDVVPTPSLVALVQAGPFAQAVIALPAFTGLTPITLLRLYRAPTTVGPWTLADAVPPSPISAFNNLFDLDPAIGHARQYVATAVDAAGNESAPSFPLMLSAPPA